MNTTLTPLKDFTQDDIQDLDVELKIGILGTVTPEGLPHLTMISSLRPYAPQALVWGQFTEGQSKKFIQENPKTGYLIMSLDKQIWRGKANYTHAAKEGPEFDNYNNQPMFRYNAYFGIHTAHYMDVVTNSGKAALPMGQVILAAIQSILARYLSRRPVSETALTPWTRGLLNKLDNLKFLGYIDTDGYPVILPIIQTQAWDAQRVLFSTGAYKEELKKIPPEIPMAVFGMSFDMEDVLLRGRYSGIKRVGGISCGVVDVDWVYNSMPPNPQQIYPPIELEAVREF